MSFTKLTSAQLRPVVGGISLPAPINQDGGTSWILHKEDTNRVELKVVLDQCWSGVVEPSEKLTFTAGEQGIFSVE